MTWIGDQLPWDVGFSNPSPPSGPFSPLKFLLGPPLVRRNSSNSVARGVVLAMSGPPVMRQSGGLGNLSSGPPVMRQSLINKLQKVEKVSKPPVFPSSRSPAGAHLGPTSPPIVKILKTSAPPVLIRPGRFVITSPLLRT